MRLIEIKGLAAGADAILLSHSERRVAKDSQDCYWVYVVTNCTSEPRLQDLLLNDPDKFQRHEVSKIQHYWSGVHTITRPMQVREERGRYEVSEERYPRDVND